MTLLTLLYLLAMDPPDKVVTNGINPEGSAQTLVFEEDLRFGADEDGDEYLWASTETDLAVDKRGHMFVGDPKTNELREFDTDGKFVKLIARPGQGPGELQALNKIQFLEDGRLIVFEQKVAFLPQIQIFDKNLKYTHTFKPSSMSLVPISASFDPTGTYFSGLQLVIGGQDGTLVTKSGISRVDGMQMIHEFTSFGRKVDWAKMGDPQVFGEMIADIINDFYKGTGVFTFNNKGEMFTSMSKTYEITQWQSGEMANKIKVIKKKYKPIPNTDEERDAVIDNLIDSFRASPMGQMINDAFIERISSRLEIPPAKDPISGLLTTPEGWLLVLHDAQMATGKQIVDVFDKDGHYKGQSELDDWAFAGRNSDMRMVFKNDFAYTIETDGEDNNRLVRYKYKFAKK